MGAKRRAYMRIPCEYCGRSIARNNLTRHHDACKMRLLAEAQTEQLTEAQWEEIERTVWLNAKEQVNEQISFATGGGSKEHPKERLFFDLKAAKQIRASDYALGGDVELWLEQRRTGVIPSNSGDYNHPYIDDIENLIERGAEAMANYPERYIEGKRGAIEHVAQ